MKYLSKRKRIAGCKVFFQKLPENLQNQLNTVKISQLLQNAEILKGPKPSKMVKIYQGINQPNRILTTV